MSATTTRPTKTQGPITPTDATTTEPEPIRQRRRPGIIGAGVALIAVGVLGGAWYGTQSDDRTEVLVLNNEVFAGEPLTTSDLQAVPVSAGSQVATVPVADADQYTGQLLTGNLPAGTVLSPSMLSDGVTNPNGTDVVPVALTTAQMPAVGLRPGDQVTLVVGLGNNPNAGAPVAEDQEPNPAADLSTPGRSWRATVVSVGTEFSDTGAVTIDMGLEREDSSSVAAAAAGANLVAVLRTAASEG